MTDPTGSASLDQRYRQLEARKDLLRVYKIELALLLDLTQSTHRYAVVARALNIDISKASNEEEERMLLENGYLDLREEDAILRAHRKQPPTNFQRTDCYLCQENAAEIVKEDDDYVCVNCGADDMKASKDDQLNCTWILAKKTFEPSIFVESKPTTLQVVQSASTPQHTSTSASSLGLSKTQTPATLTNLATLVEKLDMSTSDDEPYDVLNARVEERVDLYEEKKSSVAALLKSKSGKAMCAGCMSLTKKADIIIKSCKHLMCETCLLAVDGEKKCRICLVPLGEWMAVN